MSLNNYSAVVCLEVPLIQSSNKFLFQKGQQYQAKKNNPQGFWWVGIHGQGGHLLGGDDFKRHFKIIQS